jgi:hypothetical protein
MANISSYPLITPKAGDLVLVTETYDVNAANPVSGNPTRSATVGSITSMVSTPTLQIVTDAGSITTSNVTALGFKTSAGLSTDFLKANGTIDSSVYALASSVPTNADYVDLTTHQTIAGNKTFTNAVVAQGFKVPAAPSDSVLLADGGSKLVSDFVDLTTGQTISGDKTFLATIGAAGIKTPTGTNLNMLLDGGGVKLLTDFGVVDSVVAGSGVTVNNADPKNPIVSSAVPYTTYAAIMTQDGVNAPSATVVYNNVDAGIIWERSSAGIYYVKPATPNGTTFPPNKVIILTSPGPLVPANPEITATASRLVTDGSGNYWVEINTSLAGVLQDSIMDSGYNIEIKVYS